ncbi:MAG: nicotinate (nicotinamide) nucleotide adenylyltransferase [Rikenellaceae bacterium]
MKRVMLYFGSFNPIHKGHIALAEYAVESGLCDELVMVVSPRNPLKESRDLAPEMDRFEMAQRACDGSRYPESIKPSVIEFLLERPSYTINTLRHLTENYGSQMTFSILMGGDLVGQLSKWKEHEEILENYPIYVYPREGEVVDQYLDKIALLSDVPLWRYSSTQIRSSLRRSESVADMLPASVLEYIREKKLWDPREYLVSLDQSIEEAPSVELYVERGRWYFHNNEWGKALNDFNRALALDDTNIEARELKNMVQQILDFRYTDIYNP